MSLTLYASPAERRIATALVDALLAQGWSLSVEDGEEWTVKRSRDRAEVLDALATTDLDRLRARDELGAVVGTVLLIWGNGSHLISDYTVQDERFVSVVESISA